MYFSAMQIEQFQNIQGDFKLSDNVCFQIFIWIQGTQPLLDNFKSSQKVLDFKKLAAAG